MRIFDLLFHLKNRFQTGFSSKLELILWVQFIRRDEQSSASLAQGRDLNTRLA